MIFSSIPFIFFFLPFFLIIYFIVPNKFKNYILLIFSLIFYTFGEPIYVTILLFSSILDYSMGRLMEQYPKKKKIFLIISVVVNLALLCYFKYMNFFVTSLNTIFSSNIAISKIILPIGISFFTFQTMSYSIDVYKGSIKAEKNFFNFLCFVSMFPQLIAGPIVRYQDIQTEMKVKKLSFENFSSGIVIFLNGLFKKVILANSIGYLFDTLRMSPSLGVLSSWLIIISFALQLYYDFSGYSEMAIGMGKMIGFTFPENFKHPYFSFSISEFFRKWHITLTSFFKDYVYIPLGGKYVSKIINMRNILIVWLLTGLWHGANYNFILWGLFFGIVLVLEKHVFSKWLEKIPKWIRLFLTVFIVLIGWVLFAFEDLSVITNMYKNLFGFNQNAFIDAEFIFYFKNYFFILIIGIIFCFPLKDFKWFQKLKNYNGFVMEVSKVLIYLFLFFVTISFLVSDSYNPFLYFRF